ncbi:hypothetical protein D3C78_813230 [compost metagenome]
MFGRQCFYRITIAGYIDRRGHQRDHRQDDDCDGDRRRAGEGEDGEAAGADGDARADDYPRAVPADRRQAVTLHMRRPEEFQRPGQNDEIKQADLVQRQAGGSEHCGQTEKGQPTNDALADIKPADRHEDGGG